jgi:hypothetical protein
MNDSIETSFIGNEFCQWLITNHHVENEFLAHIYFKQLIARKQIICLNQKPIEDDTDILNNWYAFSK